MKDVWLCCVDSLTKMCYAKVKIRRSLNLIHSLPDNEGNHLSTNQEMLTLVVNVLQKGYSEDSNRIHISEIKNALHEIELPTLTDQQKASLLTIPCVTEIKKHIFNMKSIASPGPDGITTELFKVHWNVVGQATVEGIQNIFMSTTQIM